MKLWPLILALPLVAAPAADDVTARAARIHSEAIVVDTHEDVPDALAEKWADLAVRGATKHFDIPRAKEGGLTAPFF
ncbi:MAG TPA: membrane dipeptidase, partial [Vicinamibacteria bacterium]|nr:membrane dipeptidase [Vicinamibacteria bacterium]